MSHTTLPNDLYEVIRARSEEILRSDPAEVDFVCRETATELAALVMEHFKDIFTHHVEDLRRRDEKLEYERDARRRSESRTAEARQIIVDASTTAPHDWAAWEERSQRWLEG